MTENKKKVMIFDYVDNELTMLQRMFKRRCKGYEAMGYQLIRDEDSLVFQSKLKV